MHRICLLHCMRHHQEGLLRHDKEGQILDPLLTVCWIGQQQITDTVRALAMMHLIGELPFRIAIIHCQRYPRLVYWTMVLSP